jgi:DNA-3-methyladenine glycosylase II
MSKRIQSFLISQYPDAESVFRVRVIPRLKPRGSHLAEAVVEVVVGQMLSGKAADTIYGRLRVVAEQKKLGGTWKLSARDLRRCGLSRSKTRTIREFATEIERSPEIVERWQRIPAEEMMAHVKTFWGMSEWTAAILALFHLGHEDVFPHGDGSIARALEGIARNSGKRRLVLDPDKARPYRSYLALYLWQALDDGIIK